MPLFRQGWAYVRREKLKVRFAIAGTINTAVGLGIYPVILWRFAHVLNYMAALFVSQALSITFAFLTTKFIAFRTRGRLFPEAGKFATFYLLLFAVNIVALPFLVEIVHLPPIIAQLGFSFTVMIGSYFWHSRITFGKKSDDRLPVTAVENADFLLRTCPSCGKRSEPGAEIFSERRAEAMPFEALRPHWRGFFKEKVFFSYRRCGECRLLFAPVFFQEAQLGDLYRSMAANMDLVPNAELRQTQHGYFDILNAAAALEEGYMEIGPDVGMFTEHCVREGRFTQYWLFEPNRAVLPNLNATMDGRRYRVVHDMFDFAAVPDRSVGVAVMIHVLDHLLQPLAALKEIREKLAPGGKLFIVTHNEASLLRRLFGRRWPAFCLQHPQLYSPASMRALLQEAGFGDVAILPTTNYFPLQFLLLQLLWACGIRAKSAPSFWGKSIGLKLGNMATIASV